MSALYLLGAEYHFAADGTWYPIVIPLFAQSPLAFAGAVLWNYAETNKERQQIRKALAYYVPDEVVDQLAKNMVDIKNSGSDGLRRLSIRGRCRLHHFVGKDDAAAIERPDAQVISKQLLSR